MTPMVDLQWWFSNTEEFCKKTIEDIVNYTKYMKEVHSNLLTFVSVGR